MSKIEDAGNTENQREADGGESVQRTDRKPVNQDLDRSHI
jgi:hypothetical protein